MQPSDAYTLRRFLPADASAVTQLTRAIYAESYTVPDMYHPERIVHLNATEQLVTVVALDSACRLVGMMDLDRRDRQTVAECTDAMVLPEHRHHHLMEGLRALLEAEAQRLGLAGVYGQAVTNHVFSQRAEEHFGSRPCAVILAAEPRSFRNLAEELPQRMSEVLYCKLLRPCPVHPVHVPEHHHAICARIYRQFELAPEFVEMQVPETPGELKVRYFPEEQWAQIQVNRVGADTAARISCLRREFWQHSRTDAVYLDLPLAQNGTPAVCRAVEEVGFFFSGIGLCFAPDGDVLRLQWLNVPLDLSLLQVENPFGRELVAYIEQHRHSVGESDHAED
jgi:serine/threonine-protein kinase RsbW